MGSSRGIAALSLLLAIPIAPSVAQAGAPEESAALKLQADEAFDARRYAAALRHYEAALAKDRDARLHYNIAQSLSALERYPEALVAYQAFIAEAPAGTLNEAQQAQLFALVEELKGKLARIDVRCAVPGARILVRGKTVGTTPLGSAVVVNAGTAKVEAIAEGYEPFEATLELGGASTRRVDVALRRVDFTGVAAVRANVAGARVFIDGAPAGVAPVRARLKQGTHVVEVRAADHDTQRRTVSVEATKSVDVTVMLERTPDRTLTYLGFGMGAVGVAAGTVTGILALSRFDKAKEQCDETAKECGPAAQADLQASKNWGVLSTAAFSVGALGIGLGTYGLLTSKPRRSAAPSLDVALSPAGVGVLGSF